MSKPTRRTLAVVAAIAACVLLSLVFVWVTGGPGRDTDTRPTEAGGGPGKSTSAPREAGRGVFPYGRVVAVTVGINRHPNVVPARHLKEAEPDAKAIGDVFGRQFGYEVVSLLGPDATKARIWETVDRYASELGERDALILYFAGHGQVVELPGSGEAGYLVPSDASLDVENRTDALRWEQQAIDMRRLVDRLDRAGAGHVLVIADACCSGFLTTARGALADWDLKNFLARRSRTVLAATTRNQKAKDGRFTARLIEQLRGLDLPDRRPTAASVYDLFYSLLKAVSRESEGKMTPQLAQVGDGDGMFVFIPASVERSEIERDLRDLQAVPPAADPTRTLLPVVERRRAQLQQSTTPSEVFALTEATDYRFAVDAEDKRRKWEERFARLERNALAGDAWAMASLHFCYHLGLGTEKRPDLALHWARQADRAHKPAGLGRYLLGRCYELGIGLSLSGPGGEELSRRLYQESADAGCALGRYGLGGLLLGGKPSKEEVLRGRRCLEQAVAAGVLDAEVDLAVELQRRRPEAPDDRARALGLLERAAARGNTAAHNVLAHHYSSGASDDPPKDLKKAERHVRQAIDLGSPRAMTILAEAFRDGPKGRLSVPADDRRAFELYDRAARAGYATALVESAKMLEKGRGVDVDLVRARERLKAALQTGDRWADYVQGVWYFDGQVLPQSDEKSLASFKRSAAKGHPAGCFWVGYMYCEGRGFKVRPRQGPKRADEKLYHEDWVVALHYLACARQLGVEGDRENEYAIKTLNGFKDALLERESSFARHYPAAPTVKGSNIERQFWFLFYTLAAKRIADDWRAAYPSSFAWFCSFSEIDPKSLQPIKKPEAKPGGK